MKNKDNTNGDDISLFREAFSDVRQLKQDTLRPDKPRIKEKIRRKEENTRALETDHFSDEFEPHLEQDGPTRYVRSDAAKYELKKLRRGDYAPEIFLDLHGLTQQEAKKELGGLLALCKKRALALLLCDAWLG